MRVKNRLWAIKKLGAILLEDSATIFGAKKICDHYTATISKNKKNFATIWEKSDERFCDQKKNLCLEIQPLGCENLGEPLTKL